MFSDNETTLPTRAHPRCPFRTPEGMLGPGARVAPGRFEWEGPVFSTFYSQIRLRLCERRAVW